MKTITQIVTGKTAKQWKDLRDKQKNLDKRDLLYKSFRKYVFDFFGVKNDDRSNILWDAAVKSNPSSWRYGLFDDVIFEFRYNLHCFGMGNRLTDLTTLHQYCQSHQ